MLCWEKSMEALIIIEVSAKRLDMKRRCRASRRRRLSFCTINAVVQHTARWPPGELLGWRKA
jgi:hypothetical protein